MWILLGCALDALKGVLALGVSLGWEGKEREGHIATHSEKFINLLVF